MSWPAGWVYPSDQRAALVMSGRSCLPKADHKFEATPPPIDPPPLAENGTFILLEGYDLSS
jgi:hypothetical protein